MIRLLIIADMIMAGIILWQYRFLPQEIPLFYSRPWGQPQIADYWYLLLLPILMHIFVFANIYLSTKQFSSDNFLKKIFNIVNGIMIISMTAVVIKIVLMVT